MSIEKMKHIQDSILCCVEKQTEDLKNTDTEELGQAIDMIKDLSEAIYHTTITEAMEEVDRAKREGKETEVNYYSTYPRRMLPPDGGYMYYTDGGSERYMPHDGNNPSYYTEMPMGMWWDPREGRSALRRKMYMEGKEQHKDTASQLRELEAYLQELSSDITEMIQDASPEERAALRQKMTILVSKIV